MDLRERCRTLLPLKLRLGLLVGLWLCVPYFVAQHVGLFPVTLVPEIGIEHLVPFWPDAAWIYYTLYLLMALPAALMTCATELRRYAVGMAVVAFIGNVTFVLYPTGVNRPVPDDPGFAYSIILAADLPVNACPSLHAALAVFAALCCGWLPRGPRLLVWAWTAAILLATLATRQHVLIDLIGGIALGAVVFLAVNVPARAITEPTGKASVVAGTAAEARALVAGGIEEEIDALRRFDLAKRLAELAFFVALWIGGAALTLTLSLDDGPAAWACYVGGIVLSAIAINAFVLLLHEGMHHTLFASPAANRWVSVALGSTVLMSFTAYQVMHLRHHTYLGDPRDPDDYQNHTRHRGLLWTMHFVRLFAGSFLYLMFIPRLAWKYGTAQDRRRVVEEYLCIAGLAALVALTVPGWVILHGWFLPALVVGWFTNVRGFTQHGITDAADPFLASRSIQPNPLVAFCLLNENYHLEHHFFPEVPSYHLPALHRLIWPRLPRAVTGRSYVAFLARFLRATLTLDETPIGLEARSCGVGERRA